MKLIVLLFVMVAVNVKAQDIGLGIFKINQTTTSIIKKLSDSFSIPIRSGNEMDYEILKNRNGINTTKHIWLLKVDTSAKVIVKSSASFLGSTYLIDYIDVGPLPFSQLYLSFYNDTLIKVGCYGATEIKEALSYKYNDPKVNTSTQTINCVNGLGIKIPHEEKTFTIEWVLPAPYTATQSVAIYYDDDCKEQSLSVISISDKRKDQALAELDDNIVAEIEKRRNSQRLSKYKDL